MRQIKLILFVALLSASVPQSLKEKIVKGEYIDLALLLEKVGKVK